MLVDLSETNRGLCILAYVFYVVTHFARFREVVGLLKRESTFRSDPFVLQRVKANACTYKG